MPSVFDDFHQQQQPTNDGNVFDSFHRTGGLVIPDLKTSKSIPAELQGSPKKPWVQTLQNGLFNLGELPRRLTQDTPGAPRGVETLGRDEQGHVVYRPAQGALDLVHSLPSIIQKTRETLSDIPGAVKKSLAEDPLGLPLTAAQVISGAIGRKVPGAPDEFVRNTQPALAYGPKNKIKYLQDLRRAIPLMQEQNPNIKVDLMSNELTSARGVGPKQKVADTFIPANRAAIEKVDTQFEPMLTRADTYNITGNGGTVADRVLNSIPDKYRLLNPKGYQDLADTYEKAYGTLQNPKTFSLRKLVDLRSTTNAQLAKFYEGLSPQVNDTLASNAHTATLESEAQALRNEIYTKADPEHNGELASELMERRGALQNVRDTHEALVNKTIGTPQPNPLQLAAGTVGVAMRGPKAMAMEAAARPATAATNIEKAFRQKMEPLLPVPSVPTTYPRNPLQLPSPTKQIEPHGYGSNDPSKVTVTTGPPLQVVEPAAPLTHTEPPPTEPDTSVFERQRSFAENPVGEGLGVHEGAPELKSNPKYTWYEEPEQRPALQMTRPPAEANAFQRLLFPAQPEGPLPGDMKGKIPGKPGNTTPPSAPLPQNWRFLEP